MATNGDRLDSWKEIAAYLGRDRTTVMRWERAAGLPVRRLKAGARSVFAYKAEIDEWLAARPQVDVADPAASAQRASRRLVPALVVAGAAVLAAAIAAALWRGSPALATAVVVGQEVVAMAADGRKAWSYRLPHVDGSIVAARVRVEDVDGDGRREVLAALHFNPQGGHGYGRVMLFDGAGRLRWQRTLDDRYHFGASEYTSAWFPNDILVYRWRDSTRIAVAYHHHTWWPSVLVTYDPAGRVLGRFVNAGWIQSLNMTTDGRHLLAAGISNSFGGATLAVLDPGNAVGTAPADGGSLPLCANCPRGAPLAYFVVPWTSLARPSDTPAVLVQATANGGIEWHAVQRSAEQGKVPEVIVTLSPTLEVVHRSVNQYFLEMRARIAPAHGVEEPPVRRWTPARGWQTVAGPVGHQAAARR